MGINEMSISSHAPEPRGGQGVGADAFEWYRSLFENAIEGIFRTGVEGRIELANPAVAKMLGYDSPSDLVSSVSHVRELYVDPQRRRELLSAVIESGGVEDFEVLLRRRDGSNLWASISARALLDADADLAGLEGMVVDISRRKAAEEALRAEQERLAGVMETVPVGIVIVDADGAITFGNAAAERILELSRSALVGRLYDDPRWKVARVDGGELPPEELPFARVKAAQRPVMGVEHAIHYPDGRRVILSVNAAPLTDPYGAFNGMVASVEDITQRKAAELALGRLAAIVDQSNDAVIAKSLDGTILSWNAAAERIYGYAPEEAIGRHVTFLVPVNGRNEVSDILRRVGNGETIPTFETVRIRKDGTTFFVELTVSPIRDTDGHVVGASVIGRDVSEAHETRARLATYAAELERSNRELEQFAYVASHDLQEPLRMVTSYVSLLEDRYGANLDETAREFMGFAVDGARRMQQLINDLLVFSRVGTRGREPVPVDANTALERALRDLASVIGERGAEVRSAHLPTVMADDVQLAQLFGHLVGNALKFGSERAPQVAVGAERRGTEWAFFVRDNGIGIAPEHKNRIFTIFQTLHSRDQYAGTGMGLAICQKIVDRHGGRIWVESNPGQGSTFWFTMPGVPEGGSR